MKLHDAITIIETKLRAERAVSLKLNNHEYFTWKCGELDKLINELESVKNIEDYKVFLSHKKIFDDNKLRLSSQFPNVDKMETDMLKKMINDETNLDLDILNYLYYQIPGTIDFDKTKESNYNDESEEKINNYILGSIIDYENMESEIKNTNRK